MTTVLNDAYTSAFFSPNLLTLYAATPFAYGIANSSANNVNMSVPIPPAVGGSTWQFDNSFPGTATDITHGSTTYQTNVGVSATTYDSAILYYQCASTASNINIQTQFFDQNSTAIAFNSSLNVSVANWGIQSLTVGSPFDTAVISRGGTGGSPDLLSVHFQFASSVRITAVTASNTTPIALQAVALFEAGDPPCFGPNTRVLCPCGVRQSIRELYPHTDVVCVSPGGTRGVASAQILRQTPANRPTQSVFCLEDGVEVTKHHQVLVASRERRDSLLRPAAEWYCSKCAATGEYMSCRECRPDVLTVPGYEPVVMRDVRTWVPKARCEQVFHVHFDDARLRRHAIVVGDGETLSETLRSSPLAVDWEMMNDEADNTCDAN